MYGHCQFVLNENRLKNTGSVTQQACTKLYGPPVDANTHLRSRRSKSTSSLHDVGASVANSKAAWVEAWTKQTQHCDSTPFALGYTERFVPQKMTIGTENRPRTDFFATQSHGQGNWPVKHGWKTASLLGTRTPGWSTYGR
mmetsp:Transcript_80586/g.184594  ORF Transcript_80586/g.184594 Transcript_80586/m.184594 type:complete len:141 (-) Transcript_80586:155-577(-)